MGLNQAFIYLWSPRLWLFNNCDKWESFWGNETPWMMKHECFDSKVKEGSQSGLESSGETTSEMNRQPAAQGVGGPWNMDSHINSPGRVYMVQLCVFQEHATRRFLLKGHFHSALISILEIPLCFSTSPNYFLFFAVWINSIRQGARLECHEPTWVELEDEMSRSPNPEGERNTAGPVPSSWELSGFSIIL